MAAQAQQRGSAIDQSLPASSIVNIDAARIEQVLPDLVQNALVFTPSGGRVNNLALSRRPIMCDSGCATLALVLGRTIYHISSSAS